MAQTKYTYSIANDTQNGLVNSTALASQIQASAIVIALDYISTSGDTLDIYMKDALSTGDKTILDGVVSAHDGVALEEPPQIVDLYKKTPGEGVPKIAIVKPDGADFLSRVSPDWSDRTTWYQKSTRVTGETLSDQGSNIFASANGNWIDLSHGKVTREDDISSPYLPKIYDNAVEVTSGFTINYVNGTVTFDSAPTGPVTADYSYESGSTWTVAPEANKKIVLNHAELDFTKDVTFSNGIQFDLWVYNPADLPNKVLYERTTYKNMKDIIKIANAITVCPAIGGMTNDIIRVVFDYTQQIVLKSSVGAELRISMVGDSPVSGEFASTTLYTTTEDE